MYVCMLVGWFIFVMLATVLITYAIFMGRLELPLEGFVRSPTFNIIAKTLKNAKLACVVHDYAEIEIFCVDCSKEGCRSCWM